MQINSEEREYSNLTHNNANYQWRKRAQQPDTQYCLLLSLSLDDSRITRGECLGRTQESSPLDWTTYLYYFYKWLYTTSPWSHVLLECSTVTWPCYVIWLLKFPRYLYLVFIIWLDICDQVFECVGKLFLFRALITLTMMQTVVVRGPLIRNSRARSRAPEQPCSWSNITM